MLPVFWQIKSPVLTGLLFAWKALFMGTVSYKIDSKTGASSCLGRGGSVKTGEKKRKKVENGFFGVFSGMKKAWNPMLTGGSSY